MTTVQLINIVLTKTSDGVFKMEARTTHYGHKLGHVKLQKVTKEQIASKIAAGVAVCVY